MKQAREMDEAQNVRAYRCGRCKRLFDTEQTGMAVDPPRQICDLFFVCLDCRSEGILWP